MNRRVILRGQVYYANLQDDGTSRQSGVRPVIICSNDIANKHSPVISVVAMTKVEGKKKHNIPTHIYIDGIGLQKSIALCEQPLTIAKSDLRQYVSTLSTSTMEDVNRGLRIQLAL